MAAQEPDIYLTNAEMRMNKVGVRRCCAIALRALLSNCNCSRDDTAPANRMLQRHACASAAQCWSRLSVTARRASGMRSRGGFPVSMCNVPMHTHVTNAPLFCANALAPCSTVKMFEYSKGDQPRPQSAQSLQAYAAMFDKYYGGDSMIDRLVAHHQAASSTSSAATISRCVGAVSNMEVEPSPLAVASSDAAPSQPGQPPYSHQCCDEELVLTSTSCVSTDH